MKSSSIFVKAGFRLPSEYIVVASGKIEAEGRLTEASPGDDISFSETPEAFAWRLRDEVTRFLKSCSIDLKSGYCSTMFVDSRLLEWFVIPKVDQSGRLLKLELVHEGRFSGNRTGLNVLFE